jgi:3-oxoacyl-[acyl-carrier protein] reductase
VNRIDLAGRIGIVTGAARGIGYAIAERLLQSGASVALWDVDGEALGSAQKALSATVRSPARTSPAKQQVARATAANAQRFAASTCW